MPGFGPIPVRFVAPTGWRATSTVWWGNPGDCAPGLGHTITHELRRGDGPAPDGANAGWEDWHPETGAPCERDGCAATFDAAGEHHHSGGTHRVWPTESGRLEPGCLYWADWSHRDDHGDPIPCPRFAGGWSNCEGRHLMGVLPDGHHWDIDGRASNCTLPDDTTHRCWVRHHDPETETALFHVDKDGATCAAGAGSIDDGNYHGFLHHGEFSAG